jgi:1-deoxy-D-xylulose-5-phosphate reductoisomerase
VKRISILGSTGSIGVQTLDVISRYPERFRVVGLAAGRNLDLLRRQIEQFRPQTVSVADRELAERLAADVPEGTRVVFGEAGLIEAAAGTDADLVVTAVVGSMGLKPTLAAIDAGKTIGLANKETLVCAGPIVTERARARGVKLIPVDSEHSAIFQCLNGESMKTVSRLVLTASGGSFRDRTRAELAHVTVADALKHPNWSMGAKITIDSATMVNKGLEVIEAHWLFGMPYDRIEVVIHPESVVHSCVEFTDRSIIAQMGLPDMRVPIQYALTYPDRWESPAPPLDLAALGRLHFQEMDYERFRCLKLAFECGRAGGTAPAVFNAANEIAVSRFLSGEIAFLHIERILQETLDRHVINAEPELEDILEADRWARETASRL